MSECTDCKLVTALNVFCGIALVGDNTRLFLGGALPQPPPAWLFIIVDSVHCIFLPMYTFSFYVLTVRAYKIHEHCGDDAKPRCGQCTQCRGCSVQVGKALDTRTGLWSCVALVAVFVIFGIVTFAQELSEGVRISTIGDGSVAIYEPKNQLPIAQELAGVVVAVASGLISGIFDLQLCGHKSVLGFIILNIIGQGNAGRFGASYSTFVANAFEVTFILGVSLGDWFIAGKHLQQARVNSEHAIDDLNALQA